MSDSAMTSPTGEKQLELQQEETQRKQKAKQKQRKKRAKRIIRISLVVVLLAIVAGAVYWYMQSSQAQDASAGASGYVQTPVRAGPLEVTVYGSGMIQAANQPNVLAETDGTLVELRVSVGDEVSAGDVVAVLENSSLHEEITSLEYSLWSLDNSITSSLTTGEVNTIRAPSSGRIKKISASPGDDALAVYREQGNVAILSTDGRMKVSFSVADGRTLALGDTLVVRGDGFTREATVTDLIMKGTQATATILDDTLPMDVPVYVETKDGDFVAEATLEINKPMMVSAFGGTIKEVRVSVGEQVSQRYTLFTLDDAPNSLETENLRIQRDAAAESLQNGIAKRESLIVIAPVDGVVATISSSVGDSIQKGANLMSILQGEEMVLTIAVDELDVVNVESSQPVQISVDALPNLTIDGTVDRISPVGSGTSGVTSYDVLLNFSAEGTGVRAGMNASGEIQVAYEARATYIPVEALMTIGNETYVLVVGGEEKEAASEATTASVDATGVTEVSREGAERPEGVSRPEGGSRPEGFTPEGMTGGQGTETGSSSGTGSFGDRQQRMANMEAATEGAGTPEGTLRAVTTGLVNDDYVQILSGLSVGEIVLYQSVSTASTRNSGGSTSNRTSMGSFSMLGF